MLTVTLSGFMNTIGNNLHHETKSRKKRANLVDKARDNVKNILKEKNDLETTNRSASDN